jgi:hypothetical protein
MIIAGIDEAGYGPLLGPLVVGCCAFELGEQAMAVAPAPRKAGRGQVASAGSGASEAGQAAVADDPMASPCVWSLLRRYVSRNRGKTDRKIHVNDSKQVYSPSIGLKELERSVLAIMAARDQMPANLNDLLQRVAPHCIAELAEHPWYATASSEAFPCEQDALPIKLFAKSLRAEMETKSAKCVHMAARVVSERPFNRMVSVTNNKASVLFTQAATHLEHLIRTFGERDLFIFCDRQGGRTHYGDLLRMTFEDWSLEILQQGDEGSVYFLHRRGHTVRIVFCEKAEAQCLPVAVASMISKYLREALMRRFNAYWNQHAPDVSPTAGYHPDGVRFADQILKARRKLGIPDEDLIRLK